RRGVWERGSAQDRDGAVPVLDASHSQDGCGCGQRDGPEDAEGGGAVIVGVSPAIRRALVLAERYARTQLPVLLVGATGTGKELFAEHIHERSGRPGPLVDVNCGALPREMVESLLFVHRRGAFTGAVDSKVGHVERSDGGTLFLDELTSLAPEAQ